MKRTPHLVSVRLLLCSVVSCIALLSLLVATPHAQAAMHAPIKNVKLVHMQMLMNAAVKITPNANTSLLPCLSSTTLPLCYSPQQIRRAYGVQGLHDAGYKGRGQTIVIIDTFQAPTVRSDLQLFDKIFNLPDAKLNIIAPFGLKPFSFNDPGAVGFAGEIALDVEWAHAIAPTATLDLVLGNPASDSIQDQLSSLVQATKYAVDNNLGSTLSQSFGAGETCFSPAALLTERQTFRKARDQHMTVFASSGDSGSASVACDSNGNPVAIVQGVAYPESDPLVISVGGTTLSAKKSGTYTGETTWNESSIGAGATGGGFSAVFPRPTFQDGVPGIGNFRGVADVAYNADPLTGVPVVTSSILPGATIIAPSGGTSAGSPQWAAIVALIDQAAGERLGFLNQTFYRILKSDKYSQAFHDVTQGNNAFTFSSNGKTVVVPGFNAGPGWDPTTGIGSPKAAGLAHIILSYYENNDGSDL